MEEKHSSADSDSHYSERDYLTKEDRRLVRKVDLRLLPILTSLYLLSFLDRTNIGNAKQVSPPYLKDMKTDLGVTNSEYNTSLALYFIAYVIFEVPANVSSLVWLVSFVLDAARGLTESLIDHISNSLKRFNPQLWLPTLTLVWGVAHGGRHERSWRVALFFGGAALAGAFGGILAYAIGKMDGVGGRKGWEWIFIIEGVITVAASSIAYFVIPTWSYKAKFLTESERHRLLERLNADSDAGSVENFNWFYVKQALTDHLVWGYALLFHGYAFVLYSLSLFLPSIIQGLGFASWQAQLLTVPPNTLASISIWVAVWISARYDRRAIIIITAAFVAIIGYIILLTTKTAGAQYVGVHFAAAGVYTGNALLLSWPGENVSAQTKRAIAVAMQITIGDIGAISGVLIYRPSLSANRYRKPHLIAIGYLLFSVLVASYLWWWMSKENKRRAEILRDRKEKGEDGPELSPEEKQRLGDRALGYRYVY
ncbi:hypothetical protein NP233_g1151 [Leucocoprinus birnbaumii]|uniref:MFS general substrate transporter n=1 Tax=Leucocoprinus birnbaumii TaxID=56174 RepID=A0AAD5YY66_9AGAR|nr:hypothetical protein NP233_g1151 [Leucocoprinus birnbaumii]